MDMLKLILDVLKKKGEVRVADIVDATGFSRKYIHRFFQQLQDEGRIILLGRANKARYIWATAKDLAKAREKITQAHRILNNTDLNEDVVLNEIKSTTGIFLKLPKNVSEILDYAFTEMLNNAIEHSCSKKIEIKISREDKNVHFQVLDKGVGIFNNIIKKKKLKTEMEAVQDVLKGKLTTDPKAHSGEGIFFTSKVADILTIQSSSKKILFNNLLEDVAIGDVKNLKGAKVNFSIGVDSKRKIGEIFGLYTDDSFKFSKTKVTVRLYQTSTEFVSRSQARRIVAGLDKFKTIVLDFKGVNMVGQAFADEIFRVWQKNHRSKDINYKNANENIKFMIERAIAG